MDVNFTLTGLVDVIGLVQGVVLGTVFLVRGRRHQSFVFLGLFLIGYAGSLVAITLDEWGLRENRPALLFMPLNFYFSSAPALYLYVRSLTKGVPFKIVVTHLWPALVEFAVFTVLFLLPENLKLELSSYTGFQGFLLLYHVGAIVYSVVYLLKVFYLARTHNVQIEAYYSNVEGRLLTWIQWIAGYILATMVVLLLLLLFKWHEIYPNLLFWLSLINVTFIYAVAISGLSQIRITLPEDIEEEDSNAQIPRLAPYQTKVAHSNLAADTIQTIAFGDAEELQQISIRIRDEAYYRNPGLTLGKLAGKLHYSQRRLSNLINDVSGTNFSAFIHRFRVEAAQALLRDPDYAHYTMTAIAEEVGFSSKATFYAVFKRSTGSTPLQFQRAGQLDRV